MPSSALRHLARAAVLAASAALASLPIFAVVSLAAGPAVSIDDAATCMDGSTFCYRPANQTVAQGTTVTVTNSSMAPHSLTRCTVSACGSGNTGNGSQNFDTGQLSSGSKATITLTQPGTYIYYCTVHGYNAMHGSFTVTASNQSSATPSPTPSSAAPQGGSTPHPDARAAGGSNSSSAVPTPTTGSAPDLRAGALLVASGMLLLAWAHRRRAT